MNYTPELGQMAFSNTPYTDTPTPGYITAGIEAIDDLYAEHVEGKNLDESFRPGRCSNSGEPEVVNEVFALRSYCWCDGERVGHQEGCPPNFEHFASGFKAFWYKHAERGETCNNDVSRAAWREIQRECEDWITSQPAPYRILVTGSREWAPEIRAKGEKYRGFIDGWKTEPCQDREVMIGAFRQARKLAGDRHIVVVNGAAEGADHLARLLGDWADNSHSESHPADWKKCIGANCTPAHRRTNSYGEYCPTAGHNRNQKMVDLGADICLTFFKTGAGNRGTKHCSDLARKAGIEVVEVWG